MQNFTKEEAKSVAEVTVANRGYWGYQEMTEAETKEATGAGCGGCGGGGGCGGASGDSAGDSGCTGDNGCDDGQGMLGDNGNLPSCNADGNPNGMCVPIGDPADGQFNSSFNI